MGKQVSNKKQHYMIQVDWPSDAPPPRMRDMKDLFADTGVHLDENYGPIMLKRDKYAVRGSANEEARKQASQLRGVKFLLES